MNTGAKIYDSIFTHMFSNKEYAAQIVESLHPGIKCNEDEIEIVTLENVLTTQIYNDLGILYHNQLIILVEAQSTYSPNFILRAGLYMWETYKRYLEMNDLSLHSKKKLKIPGCEMYMIYTGDSNHYDEEITLSNEFFDGVPQAVEVIAKVIKYTNKDDIINQYICFCEKYKELKIAHKIDRVHLEILLDECINEGVLSKYFSEHKGEIMNVYEMLFNQEEATRVTMKETFEEGLEQGQELGEQRAYLRMLKNGVISVESVCKELNISQDEVQELLSQFTD